MNNARDALASVLRIDGAMTEGAADFLARIVTQHAHDPQSALQHSPSAASLRAVTDSPQLLAVIRSSKKTLVVVQRGESDTRADPDSLHCIQVGPDTGTD